MVATSPKFCQKDCRTHFGHNLDTFIGGYHVCALFTCGEASRSIATKFLLENFPIGDHRARKVTQFNVIDHSGFKYEVSSPPGGTVWEIREWLLAILTPLRFVRLFSTWGTTSFAECSPPAVLYRDPEPLCGARHHGETERSQNQGSAVVVSNIRM